MGAEQNKIGRILIVCLFSALIVFCTTELACFLFFKAFKNRFTFFETEKLLLQAEKLERAGEVYDRELGWYRRFNTPFGERPRPVDYNRPYISVFGDSYTFCDQVADNQTFQTYLSKRIKADVLNFGVGGYGTDQAFLRFRRDYPKVKTPIVVLGLITENINRIVNVYRRYYYIDTELSLTKPRFYWEYGERKLFQNPIQSTEEIPRLRDPDFIRSLGAHDWWYNRDSYPVFEFPYSAILFNKRLWLEVTSNDEVSSISDINPRPWENLWENNEVRELLFSILDSFVAESKVYGAKPIIMLFPRKREVYQKVKGEDPANAARLMSFCREKGYLCFNSIDALANKVESLEEIENLYHGHLTPRGNSILADKFHRFLIKNNLAEPRAGEQSVITSER